MAISQDRWDVARAMFEGGASLFDISSKTGIDRSTVSKKAKKIGWEKGINQHLVVDEVRIEQEKSTLNQQQIQYHDFEVAFKQKLISDIEKFSNNAIKKASQLVSKSNTGSDFKSVVEGVDKLSVMTKINDRHAKPTQIQQNNQTVVADALGRLAERLPS